jgi:uncharacterized protein YodC (DUF2158 family)
MTFTIGERVRSKFGGPAMIVMGFNQGFLRTRVMCEWLEAGKPHEASFLVGSLQRTLVPPRVVSTH